MIGGAWLPRRDLDRLIQLLRADGRTVIGPTVVDGAIVYDEIEGAAVLPHGVTDEQAPGGTASATGRREPSTLRRRQAAGKRYTFPPVVPLGSGRRTDGTVTFEGATRDVSKLAFLGARACDVAASEPHSTHQLALDKVIGMAQLLGSGVKGSFLGIGGADFGLGSPLSDPVSYGLPALRAAMAEEIERLQR